MVASNEDIEQIKTLIEKKAEELGYNKIGQTAAIIDPTNNPHAMHNYYTFLYNKAVFNLLKEVKGEKEAVEALTDYTKQIAVQIFNFNHNF